MPRPWFLEKYKLLLAHRPFIVGTMVGGVPLKIQLNLAKRASVDLIEVRLDSFSQMRKSFPSALTFATELLKTISRVSRKPLLLTFRSASENPASLVFMKRWTDATRLALLRPLMPLCDMVDVEIRRPAPFVRAITKEAHQKRVTVLHSIHDFKGPGHIGALRHLLKRSQGMGGDIFKAAVTPRTELDLHTFLSWGKNIKKSLPVLIAMGPQGTMSRYIGFSFGSVLTYGHLGRSTAPGQVSALQLSKTIRSIYGRSSGR